MNRITWQTFLKGAGAKHPSAGVLRAVGGKTPSETARNVNRFVEAPEEYLQDIKKLAKIYNQKRSQLSHDLD